MFFSVLRVLHITVTQKKKALEERQDANYVSPTFQPDLANINGLHGL
jgi:hypothetical protein